MKKPESKLYEKLKRSMVMFPIELHRVENSMDLGTPDVYYVGAKGEGWAELKVIKSFPKKQTTPIKIPYRPGQFAWLRNRYWINNHTNNMLIIQIENLLFVFKNEALKEEYTLTQLLSMCSYQSKIEGIRKKELYHVLEGRTL